MSRAHAQCSALPCDGAPLINPFGVGGDEAGFSLVTDGDVAVAGAPGGSGTAIVFERQSGGTWLAVCELQPATRIAGSRFGCDVDIAGDTVIVGAKYESVNGYRSGAAYVFVEPAAGWASTTVHHESAKLLGTTVPGPYSSTNYQFFLGHSVAISEDGDHAYVGAPDWMDNYDFQHRRTEGRVLVYPRPSGGWGDPSAPVTYSESAQLSRTSDGVVEGGDFSHLGISLDVATDPSTGLDRVLVCGNANFSGNAAPGGWIHEEPVIGWAASGLGGGGTDWVTIDGFQARTPTPTHFVDRTLVGLDTGPGDNFGVSCALFGTDVAVIGADLFPIGGAQVGAAYVFTQDASGNWSQNTKLLTCDGGAYAFGRALAVGDDGTIYVPGNVNSSNAAYVYIYPRDDLGTSSPVDDVWAFETKFTPKLRVPGFGPERTAYFATSIATANGVTLAGAPGGTSTPGVIYELPADCDCVRPPGITNWWTGDGDFTDLVGGQDGTPVGNASFSWGFIGQSWWAGNTGQVNAGSTAGNFGTDDFTIELWAGYPEGGDGNMRWMQKNTSTQGWTLKRQYPDIVFWSRQSDGTRFTLAMPYADFASEWGGAGQFMHVAVTRRAISATQARYTMYANGVALAEQDGPIVDVSSTATMVFAQYTWSKFRMDEITFYDRALTAGEVQDIASALRVGKCRVLDDDPPIVTITSPPDGAIFGTTSVELDALVTDEGATTVSSTPSGVTDSLPAGGGSVSGIVPLLVEGENVLSVSAIDEAGNVGGSSVTVIRDTIPPVITVLSPPSLAVLGATPATLNVQVDDATATTLTFDANSVDFPAGGGMTSGPVSLIEGTNTITLTAVDAAGNTATVEHSLILDLTAPLVTIESPADGSCFGPGESPVAVMATIDDLTATTVDSVPTGVSDSLPPGGGLVTGAVDLVEGSNSITVSATDETDRTGSDSIVVILDTTPPVVSVLSPLDGSAVRGTIDFDAEAADPPPGSGVSAVDFFVAGNPTSSVAVAPYETLFDTTTVPDGPTELRVTATDGKGNAASDAVVAFVDNTPPDIAIQTPLDGALVGGTIDFDAFAFDGGSGLRSVQVEAGAQAPNPVDGSSVFATSVASALAESQVDTTAFPDGLLILEGTAEDAAGNTATTQIAVEVDNSAPDKTLITPADGAVVSGEVLILADAEDANLASLEILVDGSSVASASEGPLSTTVDTTTRIDGPMEITVVATDSVGNSSVCTATVQVDNVTQCTLHPETLNLKSKGKNKSVTLEIEGSSLGLLLPTEVHAWELRSPGGNPVPSTSGFGGDDELVDEDGDGVPELTLKFDRQLLISSIKAGIASGQIQSNSGIEIKIYADGSLICTDQLRIIH